MNINWETDASLDECIYWDRPEADCAGRVGVIGDYRAVICEHHFNHPPKPVETYQQLIRQISKHH